MMKERPNWKGKLTPLEIPETATGTSGDILRRTPVEILPESPIKLTDKKYIDILAQFLE